MDCNGLSNLSVMGETVPFDYKSLYQSFQRRHTVMIRSIHHVQITIAKGAEEAARAFYCGVLKLSEIEKPESLKGRGGLWVQVGDRAVHIGTEEGFDRLNTKAHIAYEVDDLTFWRARRAQEGITTETGIPIPGYERFEFRDPFGNRAEMIQALTDAES